MNKRHRVDSSQRHIASSTCCTLLRHLLSQEQTTTRGRDLEYSECVDMRYLLKEIIDAKGDRTFAPASQRPALICKTIETVVTENEMVEQPDAQ